MDNKIKVDGITLEVMRNALQSVAEEMGVTLIRTALSINIKDRRDCSSAIYTANGELVAQAEHIPLHLGLMPSVIKAVLQMYPAEKFEPGDAIGADDLQKAADAVGVTVGRGDFVFVRTGAMALARDTGSWGDYAGGPAAGLGLQSVDWVAEHEVAAVATDTWGMEVLPNETPDVFQPLHIIFIVHMGLWIGEIYDLDPLAADCASDGVYEFLFCGPPLPFSRAVGSPVNPLAVK